MGCGDRLNPSRTPDIEPSAPGDGRKVWSELIYTKLAVSQLAQQYRIKDILLYSDALRLTNGCETYAHTSQLRTGSQPQGSRPVFDVATAVDAH